MFLISFRQSTPPDQRVPALQVWQWRGYSNFYGSVIQKPDLLTHISIQASLPQPCAVLYDSTSCTGHDPFFNNVALICITTDQGKHCKECKTALLLNITSLNPPFGHGHSVVIVQCSSVAREVQSKNQDLLQQGVSFNWTCPKSVGSVEDGKIPTEKIYI